MTPQDFINKYSDDAYATEIKSSISADFILACAAYYSAWGNSVYGNNFFSIEWKYGDLNKRQLLNSYVYHPSPDYTWFYPYVVEVIMVDANVWRYTVKTWFKTYANARECFDDFVFDLYANYTNQKIIANTQELINVLSNNKFFSNANERYTILQNLQFIKSRRTGDAGINIIKEFEGLYLKAYVCPTGHWTIGYGHTKNAKPGLTINAQQAEQLLRSDLADVENAINTAAEKYKFELRQNQFDALASLLYNTGAGALKNFIPDLMANPNSANVAERILLYSKGRVNGKIVTLTGLLRRRQKEAQLYKTI